MKVVEKNQKISIVGIQLGDMFRSDPYNTFYVFIKIPYTQVYHLASLDGESYYGLPKEENEKITEIRTEIKEGKLIYYPKSSYVLTLDKL